jgi:hypothetical protein
MASLHSSLNHGFPGCFGFVEVFGIVSSAIDITKIRPNIFTKLFYPKLRSLISKISMAKGKN